MNRVLTPFFAGAAQCASIRSLLKKRIELRAELKHQSCGDNCDCDACNDSRQHQDDIERDMNEVTEDNLRTVLGAMNRVFGKTEGEQA